MSTLKQQISQLREQFQIKKQVKKEDNVYEKYRQVRDELYSVANPLKATITTLGVIARLPSPLSNIVIDTDAKYKIDDAEAALKEFAQQFQALNADAQQKGHLGETIEKLASIQTMFAEKTESNWRTFIDDLEIQQMLEPVFLEQQKTLGFHRIYSEYQTALDNFNRQKAMGPAMPAVVKKLQEYCTQMVQLKGQMEFEAPPSVLAFFQELDRSNRASLTLLTPEVLAWLKEKETLNSFNVMRKGLLG
ncbi:hypothetical protein SRABI13_02216 [Erwinia aphidicola]|uniref:protein DpdI n=1 Tax=Erwinia aphidicola TaxID=68334 RepID=UPI001DFEA3A3|nr:protein DpdI [Erwinia aphidicola]CAH0221120.1 hypothetical protein SRABI13_02216 [Erwinia aphidicola]